LGFDWKMSVGVVTSFAAREVVVSTLAILYGMGEDATEDGAGFYQRLAETTRSDGTAVFNPAACWSLLVFYVLAMQCLPTQAITRRETGSWKWAIFQLVYMTGLAYGASLCTYQIAARLID
ncbi:MAG: ferrous iron transporter B, partial [Planctomycetota bacterium]|nr:ferrous iron transporter B [Planctomycetota bacterium]